MKEIYRSYGSYGVVAVTSTKQALATLGYDSGMLRDDIEQFQQDWGLVPTGTIDANTAYVIEEVFKEETGEDATIQEEKKSSTWKWIAIGAGTVGLLGLVVIATKKKK